MRLFKLVNLTKLFQRGRDSVGRKKSCLYENSGVIVYLQASLETLVERLSQDPNEAQRPSLTGKTLVSEIHDVLIKREPLYMQCADIIVDAGLSINDIIEVILAKLAK